MCSNEIPRTPHPVSEQITDALAAANIPEPDARTQVESYLEHGPTMDNARMRRVLEAKGIPLSNGTAA